MKRVQTNLNFLTELPILITRIVATIRIFTWSEDRRMKPGNVNLEPFSILGSLTNRNVHIW